MAKRARPAVVVETRRSKRERPEVNYKEPSAAVEAVVAPGPVVKAERIEYKPAPKAVGLVVPSFDPTEGKRDSKGRLVFKDHPEFTPNLTPKQVIQAGSFGGIYFNPRGGRAGMLTPTVDVTHTEFPDDWFEGLPADHYRGRKYRIEFCKYKVKAGQNQRFWEEKGWLRPQDPRGWFQWYCRFYLGRRTEDDARQIGRWRGVAGEKGRWKRALVNKVLAQNKRWDDPSVSPVIRQTLLHWGYELTEAEFDSMRKLL